MNKRLQKRHDRQVARAKARVKLSEPDVRTAEQLKAAREASRPVRGRRDASSAKYSGPQRRHPSGPAGDGAAKVGD